MEIDRERGLLRSYSIGADVSVSLMGSRWGLLGRCLVDPRPPLPLDTSFDLAGAGEFSVGGRSYHRRPLMNHAVKGTLHRSDSIARQSQHSPSTSVSYGLGSCHCSVLNWRLFVLGEPLGATALEGTSSGGRTRPCSARSPKRRTG